MMLPKRVGRTVIAAISGGVDSAVAASLSHADAAVFMSNWISDDGEETTPSRCSDEDERDARMVAQHLQIPMRRLSFASAYWVQVFEPYVNALASETGNPDVTCNRYIKFGALKQKLNQIYSEDCELITGHYARLWKKNGDGQTHGDATVPESVQVSCRSDEIDSIRKWMNGSDNLLLQAAASSKDQSYFISTCQAETLRNVHFPIGEFVDKKAVRAEATRLGLPNAAKRDSVGLCFVPKQVQKSFPSFLSEYIPLPTQSVTFIDVDTNQVVGQTDQPSHAYLYTRGQGAKLGGVPTKYFCVATDPTLNVVTVCQGTHHPSLYSRVCHVESIVWWTGKPPWFGQRTSGGTQRIRVMCRTRHLVPLVPATLIGNTVHFDEPVRAITPGQYAVFYVGVVCLGGGKIVGYANE
jgi:tRNA-5-taurinomethyluridine 2-sulfurtransferase